MRRLLCVLCVFCFVAQTVQGQYFTISGENGGELTFRILQNTDKNEVGISKLGGSTDIKVPEVVSYNGTNYTVVTVDDGMLNTRKGKKVERIILPQTITGISNNAFVGGYKLKSVSLPESLRYIGKHAFSTTSITSIIIPEGVVEIDEGCFYGTPLEQVSIPNSVKTIGTNAFLLGYRWGKTVPRNLIITNLPPFVNESNCEKFGIAKASVETYISIYRNKDSQAPVVQQPVVAEANPQSPVSVEKPKQPQQPIATVSDVDVNIPAVTADNSNTFAIIFANENYQEETAVEYALNDGEMFREYCHKVLGLPQKNIHIRKDATLNNMRSEMIWMQKVAKAYQGDAQVIVYYAGHGIPDEKTGASYLLPVDGNGSVVETGYSLQKLYQQLTDLPVKRVTVFMDACFSGSKRGEGMLASARGVAIKAKPLAPRGNMVVFSAAQGDETAYPLNKQHHGLFTYYLLKKLKETNGDVTLAELYDYLHKQVGRTSIVDNGKSQTPTVMPSAGLADSWKTMKLK